MLEAEAKERRGARTDLEHSSESGQKFGRTTDKAAEMVGIGRSSVESAKAIQKRDPEIGELG